MNWQPIETAPTETRETIITDVGPCFYMRDNYYPAGWYNPNGGCNGEGFEREYPKWWIELPPVPDAS